MFTRTELTADTLPEGVVPHINKRAKRLSLRMDSVKGHIRLVIPPSCSNRTALAFVKKHHDWIQHQLNKQPQTTPFIHGQVIPFMGIDHHIAITKHSHARTIVLAESGQIQVMTRRSDPSSNIKQFFKDQALTHLTPMVAEKAHKSGHLCPTLTLRDTKSRWGSCGTDGRIMLSWRLIFAPPSVMDYVAAHEVAHLTHMDHSQRFWQTCDALCAYDMHEARQWLRDNGSQLLRIGR